MKRRVVLGFLLFLVVVVAGQSAFGALTASADPAPPVGRHRHYILNGNGERVYVGPDFCNVDATEIGFAQYHARVHVTDPGKVDVRATGC